MSTTDVWITRDGRQIPIADMETEHLQNTIHYLRQRAGSLRRDILKAMARYIADAPDGAAMACQMEADRIVEMSDDAFLATYVPQWERLIEEAAMRQETPSSGTLPQAQTKQKTTSVEKL